MKVLLIEDDPIQSEIIADYLRKDGYLITKAENGTEGMKLFINDLFDLVISDFRMPGMSGKEVLSSIRKINPFVAVIIVTAYSTIEDAVELMRLGAVDYIQKPFQVSDFLEKIRKISVEHESLRDRIILEEVMNTVIYPIGMFLKVRL